jgi:VanZ family protein
VLLYAPLGLVGALALRRRALFVAAALALALALQVAQLYLPGRVPSLADVIWNAVGLAAGMGLAAVPVLRRRLAAPGRPDVLSIPGVLVLAWIAYRLVPFVPTLDFQSVKDSLKPLLRDRILDPVAAYRDLAGWLACFHLAALRRRPLLHASLLVATVLSAEVLVIHNAVDGSDVAGAATAIALWVALARHPRMAPALLALVLTGSIAVSGLAPFELRDAPGEFHWVPFSGSLGGSTLLNLRAILEKAYVYGALLWLLREARLARTAAAALAVSILAALEAAQTRLVGHTPEITDPLLALVLALLFAGLDRGGAPDRALEDGDPAHPDVG